MEKDMNAIGIVRQMVADGQVSKDVAEKYFPELKDSEDETIRKVLIQYFSTFRLGTFAGLEPKKIIDWLEKQGEKSQGKSALEAAKEEKVDNANKVEPKDYNDIDPHFGKPIDKVEPKFKVGDWVCDDIMRIPLRVDEVLSDMYRLTDNTGGIYYQKKCDVEAVYHKYDFMKDAEKKELKKIEHD